MKLAIAGLALVTLLSSASAVAYPGMDQQAQKQQYSTIDQVKVLPKPYPIDVVAFSDQNGKAIDFSQYKGKLIMVNMWATWCPPCVRELPALADLSKHFDPKQFVLLPVSIDAEGVKQVKPFLQKMSLANFESYYDPTQQLGQVFPLDTIPATFILNNKGQLVAFARSFVDWSDPQAIKLVESLINQPS